MLNAIQFAGLTPQQDRAKEIGRRIRIYKDESRQEQVNPFESDDDSGAGGLAASLHRRRPPFHLLS